MSDDVDIIPGVRVSAEEIKKLNGEDVPVKKIQRVALVAITADGEAQDIGLVTSPIPVALTAENLLDLESITVTIDPDSLTLQLRPSQITGGELNGSSDAAGDVHTYSETLADGTVLNWTDTYNSDGSLYSHVHD